MRALFFKEINSFLSSIIGYVFILIYLIASGLFHWVLSYNTNLLEGTEADMIPFFNLSPVIFFILIPAIGTLALAFIRMSIALNQARSIGHERILARTDELTMLPNRRRLIAEIQNFATRQGSLLLLDLDGFKPVNDTYGHEAGDRVLQQVAQRFTRALPTGSLLARLGGDEFGVLVDGSPTAVMEIALALRGTLSYPFLIDGHEISIGVSIGIADNDGADDLLLRADNAMYAAKRQALGVCQL